MALSTSLPTSTWSMNATATSMLALITPFVQSPGCDDIFSTTNVVSSFYWGNYTRTTVKVSVSDKANPAFASCQPSGWDSLNPQSQLYFSPAVCPSGWTAYQLRCTFAGQTHTSDMSVAYCCASGYTFGGLHFSSRTFDGISSSACLSVIGETKSSSSTTSTTYESTSCGSASCPRSSWKPTTTSWAQGIKIHDPYHIAWDSSDKSILSPTPPDLPCSDGGWIDSWVPGEAVDPSKYYSNKTSSSTYWGGSLFWFLVIGLPVIFLVCVASCCCLCCHYRGKKRRARTNSNSNPPQPLPAPPNINSNP